MHRLTALAVVGALALAGCGGGDDDAPAADAAEAAAATTTVAPTTTTVAPAPETYDVEIVETTFVDSTRPTAANGAYAGAPDRTLRVVFHVPQGPGPFPVVLVSHGFVGTPESLAVLGSAIASEGYLVALPAYPLSNEDAPGGPTIADVYNQPADVSFVLDEVLAASADPTSDLAGLADPERIAIGGHSLGGITTLGFFNSCCADDRVDAAFPIAGGIGNFSGTPFGGISVPLLLVHGDDDATVRYGASVEAFAAANSPKYLLTLLGGTHSGILHADDGEITTSVILAFLDAYLRENDAAVAEISELGTVPGAATLEAG